MKCKDCTFFNQSSYCTIATSATLVGIEVEDCLFYEKQELKKPVQTIPQLHLPDSAIVSRILGEHSDIVYGV